MSNIALLPRLSSLATDEAVQTIAECLRANKQIPVFRAEFYSSTTFAASGGAPISPDRYTRLGTEIDVIARTFGYPELPSQRAKGDFDSACAKLLSEQDFLYSGEALKDETWAHIATCLSPNVVIWRFGLAKLMTSGEALTDGILNRFRGGIRNAFQRLWIRSQLLDMGADSPNRWKLLDSLNEDAMVQLTERPSLASDRRLCIAIAKKLADLSEENPQKNLESVMRLATIGIRLRNEICQLSYLPDEELNFLVHSVFSAAIRATSMQDQNAQREAIPEQH